MPRRSHHPSRAALAALIPLMLCAATGNAATPPQPIFVCQNGVCWLDPAGVDSDGDGYSDADEKLAGTDPTDPQSRPYVMELLTGFVAGVFHAASPGFREVVVLPTAAPDGSPIGAPELPAIEGRKSALERLGLTDGRIGSIDVSNGVHAVIGAADSIRNAAPDMPVLVGGIDVRLISNLHRHHYETENGSGDVWVDDEGNYQGHDAHWFDGEGNEHWASCSADGSCVHTSKPYNVVMTDPDYWGGALPTAGVRVATADEVAAYRKRVGTNTNFGEGGPKGAPDVEPEVRGPYDPTIVLIDPSNDAVWLTTPELDPDYNRFGGNVNTGRPDLPEKPSTTCPGGAMPPC